ISPNSRAHFSKTASGSRLASGILPMMKLGLGPGGRSMETPVYRETPTPAPESLVPAGYGKMKPSFRVMPSKQVLGRKYEISKLRAHGSEDCGGDRVPHARIPEAIQDGLWRSRRNVWPYGDTVAACLRRHRNLGGICRWHSADCGDSGKNRCSADGLRHDCRHSQSALAAWFF